MTETFKPETPEQVEDAVRWALAGGTSLEIVGRGSKRTFGRPVEAEHRLDLSALAGIVDYEPNELVMSVRPGTPLTEIDSVLAPNRQQLAFEPADWGTLLGSGSSGTMGGAIACNLTGPRRLRMGAARDHVWGFRRSAAAASRSNRAAACSRTSPASISAS